MAIPLPVLNEEQLATITAAAYLQDLINVIDNDARLLEHALNRARRAHHVTVFTSEEERAQRVGASVLDGLRNTLSSTQRLGPLGSLVEACCARVDIGDLGAYYLRKFRQSSGAGS